MKTLQLLTLIMGLVSIGMSAYIAIYFHKATHELGKALKWMLAGEAFGSIVVTLSSAASYFGLWGRLVHPDMTAMIRMLMFLIVMGTSIHLYRTLIRLTGHGD